MPVYRIRWYRLSVCLLAAAAFALLPAALVQSQPRALDLLPQPRPGLHLLDLAIDVLASGGGATVRDEALQLLQGGNHDPRKNGFTLQNVELSLIGAVEPYFTAEVHGEFFVEPRDGTTQGRLAEAFLTTRPLPFGLQVQAGFFLTNFGLLNPTHPHAWDWQDQPIINTRLFGPDGMRQAGLRLGWLLPLLWSSELFLGAQHPRGDTMASFLASEELLQERAIAGRPFVGRSINGPEDLVYLVRWENFANLNPEISIQLGGSALFGPNATGPDGRTSIYGGDVKMRWRSRQHFRGWPFFLWQAEIMQRAYRADDFVSPAFRLPEQTLHDWGLYTQALYGFHQGWATGLRFEYASGRGTSVLGRNADPFRDQRYRVSPLLVWHPAEFARLRLQYNYDHAAHLAQGQAHGIWLGVEFLYGSHPAHQY